MIPRIFDAAAHSLTFYVGAGMVFGVLVMVPLADRNFPSRRLSAGGLACSALLLLFLVWMSQGHVTFPFPNEVP